MNDKEEIEEKLISVQKELNECLNMLKPYELKDDHLVTGSICEGIGHIAVALLHFEKTKNELNEPWQEKCSFCKKSETQVSTIIQGPSVWICNECINICNKIVSSGENSGEIS